MRARLGGAICTATRLVIRAALRDAAVAIALEFEIPAFWLLALVEPATTFIVKNAGC